MVTPAQKTLVQESFALVAPIADDAAALFYRRLFEIDPSLQRMFRGDMSGSNSPMTVSTALINRVRSVVKS